MKITEKKKYYMDRLSDENGIISALAFDQRGALKKLMKQYSSEEPSPAMMEQLKVIVADELTEIYTFEVTYINENGGLRGITSEKVLKNLLDADDVKLIRRQQFITKCHEEEV